MFKLARNARVVLTGILFAMIGFSYAMATSSNADQQASGASARAVPVGSGLLRFTNPITTTDTSGDRDLGDVLVGVQFSRTCFVTGGTAPYSFTSTTIGTYKTLLQSSESLALALDGTVSGLLLGTNLKIVEFGVTVTDGTNYSVSSPFRVTLAPAGAFEIAENALPDAVEYLPYKQQISVIGGKYPFTYTVTSVSGVTGVTSLAMAGLGINSEGDLFGNPIVTGKLTIGLTVTDSSSPANTATGRAGGASAVTLNIAAGNGIAVANDGAVTTSLSAKGKSTITNNGSLNYSALVNLNGKAVSSLAGAVIELDINGYKVVLPALDGSGNAKPAVRPGKGVLSAIGSLKGNVLKITTKSDTIGEDLNGKDGVDLTTNGTKDLVVKVKIVDQTGTRVISSSEVLSATNKAGSSGFSLTYKLGAGNLAGTFVITSVSGKQSKDGTTDAFKVGFIALAPAGGTVTADGATATVGNTTATTTGTLKSSGTKITVKGAKTDSLSALSMDTAKGKGSATTGALALTATGVPAVFTGGTAPFQFGVDLTSAGAPAFHALDSTTIFGKGTSWTAKNPSK